MTRILTAAALAAAALAAFTTVADAQDRQVASATATRLSAADLEQVLVGKTLSATNSDNQPYQERFNRDKTIEGWSVARNDLRTPITDQGTWRISPGDNKMCDSWNKWRDGAERCWGVTRDAQGYAFTTGRRFTIQWPLWGARDKTGRHLAGRFLICKAAAFALAANLTGARSGCWGA